MERRILAGSYLYWIWSNGTTFTACCFPSMSLQRDCVLWVFVCSVNLSLFSGYHAEGYHAPPIPYGYHAEGNHARTYIFKLTGSHVYSVTTPDLPRSIQTSGYRRVITPAGSFSLFFLSSANTLVLPQQQPHRFHRAWRTPHGRIQHAFSTEPGAHSTDPLNTFPPSLAHRTDPLNTNRTEIETNLRLISRYPSHFSKQPQQPTYKCQMGRDLVWYV